MKVKELIRELEYFNQEVEVHVMAFLPPGKNGFVINRLQSGRNFDDKPIVVILGNETI